MTPNPVNINNFISIRFVVGGTPSTTKVRVPITVVVGSSPKTVETTFPVKLQISPSIPKFDSDTFQLSTKFKALPIRIKLKDAIMSGMRGLLESKVNSFFDPDRVLKTVLNFGQDYQSLLTNWKYDSSDKTGSSIVVKLYRPLPTEIQKKTKLWVSRELSSTVIDQIHVKYTPPAVKLYLRPANTDIKLSGRSGKSIENVTSENLFSSGAFSVLRQSDPIMEEWYTDDVNSVELNVDYSDYTNFIFFGSARSRLQAFVQKLSTIEEYDGKLSLNSSSLAITGVNITGSLSYPVLKDISDKRMDLIRSFDPYERFLYYKSEIPYSSSFYKDEGDEFFYNQDCTWPKISGSIAPIASASDWIKTQLVIADAYDSQNKNSFANTLPEYLRIDDASSEFITFVDMVGHQFDLLKPYIDQMTNLYSRTSDPYKGISPDLIWNVAEGFGISLPNQYSINRLIDYTIGETDKVDPKVYRDIAAETWKRFLHNQIFLMKTKGTRTSLRALANSYGILPTTLQIREGSLSGLGDVSHSFETYEEQTNALNITNPAFISIPWATASISPLTTEVRFATTEATHSVLLNGDNLWSAALVPLSGSYGNITLYSGSTATVSSSYMPLYSGDFYTMMIRHHPTGSALMVKRADGDSIVDSSVTYEPLGKGLYLPGVTGSYASSNDSSTLSITSDIDIRVKARLQWSGYVESQALVGQLEDSANKLQYFTRVGADGKLTLFLSPDGNNAFNVTSSVPVPFANGIIGWVRYTWKESDGTVQFYTSEDGIDWVQLGANRTLLIGPMYDTSTSLNIGAYNNGTNEPVNGAIYRVQIYNGIDGILSFDADFEDQPLGTTSFNEGANDALVTIHSPAEIRSAISGVSTVFTSPKFVHLGGSGSFYGNNFSGLVDEVRVWGERLDDEKFDLHVKHPGTYAGNTTTSARDSLYHRLSFNKTKNLGGGDKTVPNESPYIVKNGTSILSFYNAVNFSNIPTAPHNMNVVVREVTRYNLNAGASQYGTNNVIIEDERELKYLGDSNVPVLSPTNSIISISDKKKRKSSNNKVGFYFSLADAINDSILRSLGNVDLQSLIGDPTEIHKDNYDSLNDLNRLYWENYAYNYNVNSFVDFIDNLLEPLFTQAKDLVPVRTKFISGIVHEPHVLERPKIAQKPIKMSAGKFGKDKEVQNLEAHPTTASPSSIFGDVPQKDVTFDISSRYDVTGVNDRHDANISIVPEDNFKVDMGYTEVNVPVIPIFKGNPSYQEGELGYVTTDPLADFEYFDDSTNRESYKSQLLDFFNVSSTTEMNEGQRNEYHKLISKYKSPSTIRVGEVVVSATSKMRNFASSYFVPEVVTPDGDFTEIEAYTYFNTPGGLFSVPKYEYVRIGRSIQTERGTWAEGTTYNRNDVVEFGKDLEYVCVAEDGFVSYIDPSLDTKNWIRANYVTVETNEVKKAVLIGGKVQLVNVDHPRPPIEGYTQSHYRFKRDMRRGIINHQWLGCKQTVDTTTDGRAPVEILNANGDVLVVNNTTAIQNPVPTPGLILDVR